MYARLTKAKIKPGRREDVLQLRRDVDQIVQSLVGLEFCLGLADENGELIVITVYGRKSDLEHAEADAQEIWRRAAHLVEGKPTSKTYDVLTVDVPEL